MSLLVILFLYTLIALLSAYVPGAIVSGYVQDAQQHKLVYRLNGLRIMLLMCMSFMILVYLDYIDGEYFYHHYIGCSAWACVCGFIFSLFFFIKGPWVKPGDNFVCAPKILQQQQQQQHSSQNKKSWILIMKDNASMFFFGQELNPRLTHYVSKNSFWQLFDVKLYCYLLGSVTMELVILSILYTQYRRYHSLSPPLLIFVVEMTWFLFEYLYHEHVHLYTYDFIDENMGFKLVWGCMFFYPFFYPIGIWSLVDVQTNLFSSSSSLSFSWYDDPHLLTSAIVFVFGWILTRGANLQKYYFKINPKQSFLWITPRTVMNENRILVSGFWSLARHINYLGEILQGIALALPVLATHHAQLQSSQDWLYVILPWLYPIYYVLILFARERDDHERCLLKYGPAWTHYCRLVPYRVIPFIY